MNPKVILQKDFSIVSKLVINMDDEDRLAYIIELMSKGKMKFDKDFIDKVISFHKNDKEFMAKISKYLCK